MSGTEVLIAGAGPTGLVLALWLARLGVRFRLIDRKREPAPESRALGVQARTLEFYRQLGFAEEVVRCGIPMTRIHLREGGEERVSFDLTDFGQGVSPYPFVLSLPQDEHERLLAAHLRSLGVEVEWETELTGFTPGPGDVVATLRGPAGPETVTAAYLVGCDGAHSAVRHGLGLGFPGGTYEQLFFIADVRASGEAAGPTDLNLCLGEGGFCGLMPVRTGGTHRLIGAAPPGVGDGDSLTFADVRPSVEALGEVTIHEVHWFSTYRVHHRVAERFREGRVFLTGDAGHIHSPAGGQGMNTGIGDAVNLAWKLAAVLQSRAVPALLDTYEQERLAFARSLVHTTDQAFRLIVDRGLGGRVFRTHLLPHLGPLLFGLSAFRNAAFRTLSQTRIHYRESALSRGAAGEVHGGDRLPWVEDADNFAALRTLDWQAHVYGEADTDLRTACAAAGLTLREFARSPDAGDAGLEPGALYLVRPDGYVGLAAHSASGPALRAFVREHGIRPRGYTEAHSAGGARSDPG
jgi:2-polyprenyl-6-methoxyphenol hydroxylase-like FAD-dependent oxidoreductase